MRKRIYHSLFATLSFAMLTGTASSFPTLANVQNGWEIVDDKHYWYENGVRQGYDSTDLNYRGKEIFVPDSNAWYWLDNIQQGAKAVSKDVYQESTAGNWADRFDGTGKWVRYNEQGHMIKGWNTNEYGTYYFDPVYGTMAKGYAVIDGQLYYFNKETGLCSTAEWDDINGWVVVDCIDGNCYWYENGIRQGYNPDNAAYRGKEIYDPESDAWYWLDNIDQGKKAISKDVYQESAAGEWADCADGTGKWVRYDAQGHMIKGWSSNDNGTYYFDPVYGTMAKGIVIIDGQKYEFDSTTGILVRVITNIEESENDDTGADNDNNGNDNTDTDDDGDGNDDTDSGNDSNGNDDTNNDNDGDGNDDTDSGNDSNGNDDTNSGNDSNGNDDTNSGNDSNGNDDTNSGNDSNGNDDTNSGNNSNGNDNTDSGNDSNSNDDSDSNNDGNSNDDSDSDNDGNGNDDTDSDNDGNGNDDSDSDNDGNGNDDTDTDNDESEEELTWWDTRVPLRIEEVLAPGERVIFRESEGSLQWALTNQSKFIIVGYCDETGVLPTEHWDSYKSNIVNVCMDVYGLKSLKGLFSGYTELQRVDMSIVNTSDVTDMSHMFEDCNRLRTLYMNRFNTKKVTDMSYMFANCSYFSDLDLPTLDTSAVTNMEGMFSGCSGLLTLDITGFNTHNVTNMSSMFSQCSRLSSIMVGSDWTISNNTNTSDMFNQCYTDKVTFIE